MKATSLLLTWFIGLAVPMAGLAQPTISFFNKWLKGQDDHLHEGPSPDFPRVTNFRKK